MKNNSLLKAIVLWLALASIGSAHNAITDTRIELHQGEFVPRFAKPASNNLIVPAGQTVTLPTDSTYDAIEVSGTLKVSRTHDTICRFVQLQVLPGGKLDMGTEANPVLKNVQFIVRNVPIDKSVDPYQWGNGIFNLGLWTSCGRSMSETWSEMEEVEAGATTLSLKVPAGWQVGNELLIPDSRQMVVWPWAAYIEDFVFIRKESSVRIAAMNGNQITLTKPLDFEHKAARSPEGVVRFKPYVANASRNIVIRSENPVGSRGHTVTTDVGIQKLAWTQFVGLGRTTVDTLNDASVNAGVVTPGTNQVGKYPVHLHHVHSVGNSVKGLSIDGTNLAKWGFSTHGTSDTLCEKCVVNRCVGAGLVTEDGPEVRNKFLKNFVMGCSGDPTNPGAKNGLGIGKPGTEGAGIWMHGAMNYVNGNVCCNNPIGISFMGWVVSEYNFPSVPGGPEETPYNRFVHRAPIECVGNVTFSNQMNGFDSWFYVPTFQVDSWHNGFAQVSGEEGSGLNMRGCRLLAENWLTVGVHSNPGYVGTVTIEDSRIEGCREGVEPIIQAIATYSIHRTTLHNKLNFNWWSQDGPPAKGFRVDVDCLAIPGVADEPNFKCDWKDKGNPADNGPFKLNGAPYPDAATDTGTGPNTRTKSKIGTDSNSNAVK